MLSTNSQHGNTEHLSHGLNLNDSNSKRPVHKIESGGSVIHDLNVEGLNIA